ncbi:MAG: dTDP-glucose 4,6-dehydratase [Methylotetracoccus sp.]
MSEKQTILVTGGAGFIGGNFVLQQMARGGIEIINLDALTYAGNLDTLESLDENPDHVFVLGSIADRDLIAYLLDRYQPWAIVNFAAESHVDRSIDSPEAFIQTNVLGTFQLLEAARHYWRELSSPQREQFRLLHVSTDEVYGSLGETGLFTEENPYRPNSPYSASKASSDHLVRAYFHTYGLPVLTTNCSNNYGPYQFPEKLIPLMIHNAVRGRPLPIYGAGTNVRDWLFVADHCRAIQRVLEGGRPGEVYNVGGNSEKTNLEVVNTLCALLDELLPDSPHRPHDRLITYVADRPGHDQRYAIDASKIRQELGWEPQESFESGLRRTVRWYLDNDDWCQRVMTGEYRGERLGLSADAEAV